MKFFALIQDHREQLDGLSDIFSVPSECTVNSLCHNQPLVQPHVGLRADAYQWVVSQSRPIGTANVPIR
jgi:hypothetical protein